MRHWIKRLWCAAALVSAAALSGCSTLIDMMPQGPTQAPPSNIWTPVATTPTRVPIPTKDPNNIPQAAHPTEVRAFAEIPGGVFLNVSEEWVNVEVTVKYTLKFWNVGAMLGERYGQATMTVEYQPLTNGFILSAPDQNGQRQMKPSTRFPSFKTEKISLTFSGGPEGKFQQMEPPADVPMVGRLIREKDGSFRIFFEQGVNPAAAFTLKNPDAFNAWK